jgi:hypothetical protein
MQSVWSYHVDLDEIRDEVAEDLEESETAEVEERR